MKNDKIHLVPQAVIDCVQGLSNTKQSNLRVNYVMRLEAIRDYCDQALKSASDKPSLSNNNNASHSRRKKVAEDWKRTRDICS